MRGKFMLRQPFVQCESRAEAVERYPKAVAVIKVEGGYLCFDSIEEYLAWDKKSQPKQR